MSAAPGAQSPAAAGGPAGVPVRSVLRHVRLESLAAGLSGGVVSTLVLHPLDLVKIRFAGGDRGVQGGCRGGGTRGGSQRSKFAVVQVFNLSDGCPRVFSFIEVLLYFGVDVLNGYQKLILN